LWRMFKCDVLLSEGGCVLRTWGSDAGACLVCSAMICRGERV
jgi:hypothetical protein